nr:hypothetical protein [Angustibacter aerolatus]
MSGEPRATPEPPTRTARRRRRAGTRRWLVRSAALLVLLVAWLAVGGVGGPDVGRLSQVQENDDANFLPSDAEATEPVAAVAALQPGRRAAVPRGGRAGLGHHGRRPHRRPGVRLGPAEPEGRGRGRRGRRAARPAGVPAAGARSAGAERGREGAPGPGVGRRRPCRRLAVGRLLGGARRRDRHPHGRCPGSSGPACRSG